ncbi:RHS repeat-associated core domain-containing protein [uncultured Bacteroides sp.]|uniref:RHS repeat domain-containing protein n=1 Tax=uncultured Bacteroides sp. TaxID=162156 RepID=UPI002AAADD70|nr:RHS repeat-associated core domain-containing protein [uncultured Bacteroides sp.]
MEISIFYYYIQDHHGDNREVWRAYDKKVVQRTQYYPFGLPWGECENSGIQPYKYNGKEFIEMHGYDVYDYGARHYYPAIGRWETVDPLCEKYYWISPYAYCLNNPVRFTDPDGREVRIKGDEKYRKETFNNLQQLSSLVFNNEPTGIVRSIVNQNGTDYVSDQSVLCHELLHIGHSFQGTVNYKNVNVIDPDNSLNSTLSKEELRTRIFENYIRSEQGDEPRAQPTIINQ